eukprot:gene10796-12771_t
MESTDSGALAPLLCLLTRNGLRQLYTWVFLALKALGPEGARQQRSQPTGEGGMTEQAYVKAGIKIPMVYGIDSVHGAVYVHGATIFPQQINAGAAFNRGLAHKMGRVTAKDTRMAGMHWAFSPILGIATQPLWPRVFETFGEDPHLASQLGVAMIQGLQGTRTGDTINTKVEVAACMKHFVGYSNPRTGHDRSPEWIPDRMLYQYYVPSFAAAVQQGHVATAMESYNELNGVPMVSSKQYLQELLRKDLRFEGMLVTDWEEIRNLHQWHQTASSFKEAVRIAMDRTSIDMSMVPNDTSFAELLLELVNEGFTLSPPQMLLHGGGGVISEDRVDVSLGRVLHLKAKLGLIQDPELMVQEAEEALEEEKISENVVGSDEDRSLAMHMARESVVLLRNDNDLLPLQPAVSDKVLVTGPCAHSLSYLSGGWTLHWQGATTDASFTHGATLKDAIEQRSADPATKFSMVHHPAAVDAAAEAAYTVVCLGEPNYAEKPGNIDDLAMSGGQLQLLRALKETDTKLVLLLIEGRPRLLHGVADGVPAVLHGFLPGPEGGHAVSDIIFGAVNPSGRMPISYPRSAGQMPLQYWHAPTEDEAKFEFEFGDGLSYTTFEYTDVHLSKEKIRPGEAATVTLNVKNTGTVTGKEVVLLYIRDEYRSTTPEVRMLKHFKKLELEPGQTRNVSFTVTCDDLAFVDTRMEWVIEPGNFTLYVGQPKDGYPHTELKLLLHVPGTGFHTEIDTMDDGNIPWPMWGLEPGEVLPEDDLDPEDEDYDYDYEEALMKDEIIGLEVIAVLLIIGGITCVIIALWACKEKMDLQRQIMYPRVQYQNFEDIQLEDPPEVEAPVRAAEVARDSEDSIVRSLDFDVAADDAEAGPSTSRGDPEIGDGDLELTATRI